MNIAHAHTSHGSRFWTPGCGFFCSRCHTCTRGRPKQGRIRLCQGIAPRMIRNQPRVVCCQKHIAVTRSATEWKEMGRSGEDVAERPKQRQMTEERRRPRRSHSRGAVAMRSPLAHDKIVWFDSFQEKLDQLGEPFISPHQFVGCHSESGIDYPSPRTSLQRWNFKYNAIGCHSGPATQSAHARRLFWGGTFLQ